MHSSKKHTPLHSTNHLPLLLTVPLSNKGDYPDINIISYDMNDISFLCSASGETYNHSVSNERIKKAFEKENEKTKQINKNVRDGIIRCMTKFDHDVGVIVLQRTATGLVKVDSLRQDWVVFEDAKEGLLTYYNNRKYCLEETSLDKKSRIRTLKLKDKNNNNVFIVHNMGGRTAFNVMDKEELLKNQKCISIVVGNVYSELTSPEDYFHKNQRAGIVLVTPDDEENDISISDDPDGCLYSDENGIHQITAVSEFLHR